MNPVRRNAAALAAVLAVALGGCSTSIKATPGLEALAAGDDQRAFALLQEENAAGVPGSKYGLGVLIIEGRGVTKDVAAGEGMLVEAALAGDPRAVSYLVKFYSENQLCPKDKVLSDQWWGIGLMQRNLISGVIETSTAAPVAQIKMAQIYAAPCEGRPARPEVAQILTTWSRLPRQVMVYVP